MPHARLVTIMLLVLAIVAVPMRGQVPSSPAGRFSKNVVVIEIRDGIDAMTSVSVVRRIREAEASGADAIVMDIDTPGGTLGAVLEITGALKRTSVPRTVAWINPTAFSGGAIIAIACKEIVVAPSATLGDAAPVKVTIDWSDKLHPKPAYDPLPPTERAKALAPLLTDVVSSARQNHYDELLVQGMVSLGVELWLVEHTVTKQRLLIDRAEHALLFDGEPPVSRPRLAGPLDTVGPPPVSKRSKDKSGDATDIKPTGGVDPAAVRDANFGMSIPTNRPVISAADKGSWKLIEYVCTGNGIVTMSGDDAIDLRLATARVANRSHLDTYLGASSVVILTETWYEAVARWLSSPAIQMLLVVVIILGLFIEFVHPGLVLPGTVAGIALIGLMLPGILMGLAGWWVLAAVLLGAALIAIELYVTPGIGILGGLGVLLLFGGLVMAFVPSGNHFGGASTGGGLMYGLAAVLLGVTTTGVVMYYLSKSSRGLPVFNRLVLRNDRNDDEPVAAVMEPEEFEAPAAVGETGIAMTPLRPAGKAEIAGRVVDVTAERGFLDAGQPVRVVAVERMRVVVVADRSQQ